ncbi:MAG: class I SAM-dependent methyltransferase [Nitrospiraceae bacterium]|nr:class I SAM-dependent methyltransferase [Nitrospiraceae bacterium]
MPVFDKFARNYDEGHKKAVRLSGFEPAYFHEYKLREVSDCLTSKGMADKEIRFLNYGCGTGNSEKYIKKYLPGASIFSVDVSEESIKVARESNKGLVDVTFEPLNGPAIPFDGEFDVIFIANVFHHIRHEKHIGILKDLYNKLREKGLLFIFELNPLNPLTMLVAIRNDYRFDKDAKLLNPFYARKILGNAGFAEKKIRYTVFFPQFLSFLTPFEKYLCRLPLGAHYFFTARKDK